MKKKKAVSPKKKAVAPVKKAFKKIEKPAKAKKSAFTTLQLRVMKKHLLEMRNNLTEAVSKREVIDSTIAEAGDSIDQASQSIEKELNFELSDNERTTLDQIEAALRKVDLGNYGFCESCRKPISKPRLKALPFARYCIDCQSSSESVQESFAENSPDFSRIMGEEPSTPEA